MLRKFEALCFESEDYSPVKKTRLDFGRYVLSILQERFSKEDLYEIAIMDGENEMNFVRLPGFGFQDDDVQRYLTQEAVEGIMLKLWTITGSPGEETKSNR